MYESILSDWDGPNTKTSRSTSRSRMCEMIAATFVKSGADAAEVSCKSTGLSEAEMYAGLRNVCSKSAFRGKCSAHMCAGHVVLRKGRL